MRTYQVLTAIGALKNVKGLPVLPDIRPTLSFIVWYNRPGKIYTVSETNTGRAIASGREKETAIKRAKAVIENPTELAYLLSKDL